MSSYLRNKSLIPPRRRIDVPRLAVMARPDRAISPYLSLLLMARSGRAMTNRATESKRQRGLVLHATRSVFPTRENPACPSRRHLGYVVLGTNSGSVCAVFPSCTTSQAWTGPRQFGLFPFDRKTAPRMGRCQPVAPHLRRAAAIAVTVEWYPGRNAPIQGMIGRAPEELRVMLETAARQLFGRHSETSSALARFGDLDYR